MNVVLDLPYPPTVNSYKTPVMKRGRLSMILSAEGRKYKSTVKQLCQIMKWCKGLESRISVKIFVYPPDNRKRDLVNLGKALLDSMQDAGVFKDDSQIDDLHFIRREAVKSGNVVVEIREL